LRVRDGEAGSADRALENAHEVEMTHKPDRLTLGESKKNSLHAAVFHH
jgi:hypothetical protein